ncbi:hypothetical protein KY347_04155 [Candidatus Woesearchaeota archaeon]|nr:hypothetical protein [Candidatus Woesearchaeota archaeon]
MLHNLDSQAAMEFLITYGWATLVVLAAISALAYFGVLSPEKFLPEKCVLSPGLACVSHKVEPSQVTLVISNGLGKTITIDSIDVAGCGNSFAVPMMSGEEEAFTINGGILCDNGNAKEAFKGQIKVMYTEKQTNLQKTAYGSIYAIISEGSTASASSICQNAEDNGLCDSLDILFGEGYKDLCCSEYGLCCS